jgi:hypothetical protein
MSHLTIPNSPIAEGKLILGTKIDEGSFGQVFRGSWATDGTTANNGRSCNNFEIGFVRICSRCTPPYVREILQLYSRSQLMAPEVTRSFRNSHDFELWV